MKLSESGATVKNGVIHGKWEFCGDEVVRCSVCEMDYSLYRKILFPRNYCPNCGAKMDSEEKGMGDYRINPIKHAREAIGMTQKQLAEATGLNHRTIQKLESGERNIGAIKARNIVAIADVLRVEPWVLLIGGGGVADDKG